MPSVDGASAGCNPTAAPSTATEHEQSAPTAQADPKPESKPAAAMPVEFDDFGLPIRNYPAPPKVDETSGTVVLANAAEEPRQENKGESPKLERQQVGTPIEARRTAEGVSSDNKQSDDAGDGTESDSDQAFEDAASRVSSKAARGPRESAATTQDQRPVADEPMGGAKHAGAVPVIDNPQPTGAAVGGLEVLGDSDKSNKVTDQAVAEAGKTEPVADLKLDASKRMSAVGVSEFSHQQLASEPHEDKKEEDNDDGEWQTMPAYAPYDLYDDDNKLIAREYVEDEKETYGYGGLGGAGKGYTKVLLDDDAESATSMDEHTQYLFKDAGGGTSTSIMDDDDTQRDAVGQLQATKELLTEGQRIAYVGLTRLELSSMIKDAEALEQTSKTKKQVAMAGESMKMWGQKMMIRLYTHMDISPAEQVMIEQLSAHGVMPQDLTPVLMANARVRNPMADEKDARPSVSSSSASRSASATRPASISSSVAEQVSEPPPPYSANDDSELTAPVRTPSQLPTTQKIDIDIRWTVLCDLFLVLIADSIYDARSRLLLEKVAKDLEITWLDICRFEKKVTDALEMQANAEQENWNEEEHMENRRKMALKRRYMMMGLATVGGGLVIGLSAGLLAPVIGLGLAAGFTTIGIGGTSGFLAGAGGAAIITSTAATSGSIIGVRAANRRTGAVKTFEYRPLHNNKRVNLIVTVSGWMTGKVDDVRLPFSTVDPVMGDIYSVLWEPEMLTSMGDTINILATEALTQGLQQVLGNTILTALMAGLQIPVILTKLAYLIDNPWAVSLDRATMAGLILADSLIDRSLGTRPVTLVGYSLGSRVIFSCLQELAKKGAFGLVQNVYLFGSPVVVKRDEYLRARTVVAGRFVNGYSRNDWILGYLFRLTNGGIGRVAGLAPVEVVSGIENMDVSPFVVGHMNYRQAMPRLMRECGWLVESDEFIEIEDPDPDKYQERQRELINEIEEARKELEKEAKGNKGGAFAFFKRKKGLQKQEWEVYEDTMGEKGGKTEDKEGNNHGVLFDVDAIRAEFAKEKQTQSQTNAGIDDELLQVKEIKSTLPPIKLDLKSNNAAANPGLTPPPKTRGQSLRETKSAEALPLQASPENKPASSQGRASHDPSMLRERTPTFSTGSKTSNSSPYHAYGYGYGGDGSLAEDDGVQMMFDADFDDPKPLRSGGITYGAGQTSSLDGGPERPEIRPAQTVPNITLADPWVDDDEDFGKEKEIKMTFA